MDIMSCLWQQNPWQNKIQRKQSSLYNTDFSIELGRIILTAKLKNQLTVLRRYAKSRGVDIDNEINMIKSCERSINSSVSIPQIMGYEGQAAKTYFSGLNKCVDDEFHFDCRSRRPPKDEFNSMLSFGYSILINEIYSEIAAKGLNPYFGFVHQDKEKHPTLASDLVEEWRAVIVDSMVMSLVNGHEIQKSNFETDVNVHGYYLNNEGLKIFVKKLDGKIRTGNKYLDYSDDRVSFRVAISYQISHLIEAINKKDASIYKPILIR